MNTYRDDYNGFAVEEREGDYRTYLGSIFTQMSLGLLLKQVFGTKNARNQTASTSVSECLSDRYNSC